MDYGIYTRSSTNTLFMWGRQLFIVFLQYFPELEEYHYMAIYKGYHNNWNKAAVSQILPIEIIHFFSDYCWKITNILIYLTNIAKLCVRRWSRRSVVLRHIMELSPSRWFKQDWWKFNFNTFPNRSQIFKLVKNFKTYDTCKDRRVTGSSPSGSLMIIRTSKDVIRVQNLSGQSLSSFEMVQARLMEVQFQHISKQESDFQVG